jgi:hypothetical protein
MKKRADALRMRAIADLASEVAACADALVSETWAASARAPSTDGLIRARDAMRDTVIRLHDLARELGEHEGPVVAPEDGLWSACEPPDDEALA